MPLEIICRFLLTPVASSRILSAVNQALVPSYLMKSLKFLLSALAYLAAAAIAIGSLAYCFAQLLIGGVQ